MKNYREWQLMKKYLERLSLSCLYIFTLLKNLIVVTSLRPMICGIPAGIMAGGNREFAVAGETSFRQQQCHSREQTMHGSSGGMNGLALHLLE